MSKHTPLSDLRKSYEQGTLEEHDSASEPSRQFEAWLSQALERGLPEPNAMTVATVGEDGRPSTRPVLIKGCDARGIVWYSNYHSRTGRELEVHPFAALQFHWVEMERVVRIEGRVEKVSAEESDAYFASRPLAHRIGAWASDQSRPLAERAELQAAVARETARFEGGDVPRPERWTGWRVIPEAIEFWRDRPFRLHDRVRFERNGDEWRRSRLWP